MKPLLTACAIVGIVVSGCDQSARTTTLVDIVDMRLPLEIAVANAERIAVVDIGSRTPVGDPENPCGYLYTANVMENIKGDSSPFAFFLADNSAYNSKFDRYLVFAFPRQLATPALDFFLESYATPIESSNIRCRSHAALYVPHFSQTFWAFNSDLSRKLGGDWIGPPSRPSVLWCWDGESRPSDKPFTSERFRSFDPGDWESSEIAISWHTARVLIERAQSNWPYSDGVSPTFYAEVRPDFEYGGC